MYVSREIKMCNLSLTQINYENKNQTTKTKINCKDEWVSQTRTSLEMDADKQWMEGIEG